MWMIVAVLFGIAIAVHNARSMVDTEDYYYAMITEVPRLFVEATHTPPKAPTIALDERNSRISSNIALGLELALLSGYSWKDWQCLYQIGMNESGWDNLVPNGQGSGAYGIAQALPASKYDSVGPRDDPRTQITWMLLYVQSRYGTPCKALEYWQRNQWY
jgi:hypothetical protein